MQAEIFKAYDVRGTYPNEINEKIVFDIAGVLARHFRKGKIVVGHDVRLSSPRLYKAVLKGFVASGYPLAAVKAGLITTPLLYFLVNDMKAAGGIMVTASHNPKEFNGLKVVARGARVVSGKQIKSLVKKTL